MNKEQMWHEVFKPAVIQLLKDKKREMENKGLIPTIELLIEEFENENN